MGEWIIDAESRIVSAPGENIELLLPRLEFDLLFKLLSYPNKIFTRRQLMDEIWGMDSEADERTVDVHIKRLREKFETCPAFELTTVRGLGYKAVRKA
jgi:DNA-binding response OmpR family regulator